MKNYNIVDNVNLITIYDAVNNVDLNINNVMSKISDKFQNKKFTVFTHAVDNDGVYRVDIRAAGHYSPVCLGDYLDVRYKTRSALIANQIAHTLARALAEHNIHA